MVTLVPSLKFIGVANSVAAEGAGGFESLRTSSPGFS